uniref:Uncharacterized protein n=1 Tax=Bombyx mori TaxID=7091 RepID=A0A8R2M793_BOMMO|nr:uncharacterized protein LOC119630431 [Bombyx mori]
MRLQSCWASSGSPLLSPQCGLVAAVGSLLGGIPQDLQRVLVWIVLRRLGGDGESLDREVVLKGFVRVRVGRRRVSHEVDALSSTSRECSAHDPPERSTRCHRLIASSRPHLLRHQ